MSSDAGSVPLVVDIDALLSLDATIEAAFALVRAKPSILWRHVAPARLAAQAPAELLARSCRPDVLAWLRARKGEGRSIALVCGDDGQAAQAVARELALFDVVWSGVEFRDQGRERRRELLQHRFGSAEFDYLAGRGDPRLWPDARGAWLVAPSPHKRRQVAGVTAVQGVFERPVGGPLNYLRAMRPHHWIKNVLLFVAVGAAHRWPDARTFMELLSGFAAFCLCASSNYLLNDLFDLESDRRHPENRHRQLASGQISPSGALLLSAGLLVLAMLIAWVLSAAFAGILVGYYLLMTLYSVRLKQIAVLDVFILAAGYALRVAAGSYVVGITPSAWLMALCVFLFLSLASVKRYAELVATRAHAGPEARVRGYLVSDASMVAIEGISSGYLAVLVLALYTNTAVAQQLYARHDLFWVICLLLLYWINYLWLMARRGRVTHDPVVFALRDRTSLLLVIAMGFVTLCAL